MRARFVVLFGLAACASAPPVPGPDASVEIRHGHDLYLAKCTLCHDAVPPMDHAPSAWRGLVERFAPRARLSQKEKADVRAYLEQYSR